MTSGLFLISARFSTRRLSSIGICFCFRCCQHSNECFALAKRQLDGENIKIMSYKHQLFWRTYLSMMTGSEGVSLRLPQLFLSQQRLVFLFVSFKEKTRKEHDIHLIKLIETLRLFQLVLFNERLTFNICERIFSNDLLDLYLPAHNFVC